MYKYHCLVLLPLTLKATGTNPISYKIMVFPTEPAINEGDIKTLALPISDGSFLLVDALLVRRSQNVEEGINVISYIFELQDREQALTIAQLIKNNNPNVFEDENIVSRT
ncbi:hypothetical protein H6G36_27155 [Anabaena minutissima FACHB-250]|nr:hypothetical protein [Anabaena minutissima FACHB-250]